MKWILILFTLIGANILLGYLISRIPHPFSYELVTRK